MNFCVWLVLWPKKWSFKFLLVFNLQFFLQASEEKHVDATVFCDVTNSKQVIVLTNANCNYITSHIFVTAPTAIIILSILNHLSHIMTKPTKWMCAQRRLRSASAQSDQSSLCAQWVAKCPGFLHAGIEDSDQTGRMPRLIWVFAGRTVIFVGFVILVHPRKLYDDKPIGTNLVLTFRVASIILTLIIEDGLNCRSWGIVGYYATFCCEITSLLISIRRYVHV